MISPSVVEGFDAGVAEVGICVLDVAELDVDFDVVFLPPNISSGSSILSPLLLIKNRFCFWQQSSLNPQHELPSSQTCTHTPWTLSMVILSIGPVCVHQKADLMEMTRASCIPKISSSMQSCEHSPSGQSADWQYSRVTAPVSFSMHRRLGRHVWSSQQHMCVFSHSWRTRPRALSFKSALSVPVIVRASVC